jgi:DNA gyrase/topoisomerase IV subunit A
MFIDDFRLYRNIYRAIKGIYLTLANLDYIERRKPTNQFVVTLRPYRASFSDLVRNIELLFTSLAKGVKILVREDGLLIKVFASILTGNIPQ